MYVNSHRPNCGRGNCGKSTCAHTVVFRASGPAQATVDPCPCQRPLGTHRQVWLSLWWGHCSYFLAPGAHKVLFVPFESLLEEVLQKFHNHTTESGSK